MSRTLRRLVATAAVVAAVGSAAVGSGVAASGAAAAGLAAGLAAPTPAAARTAAGPTTAGGPVTVVDDLAVNHLPEGLGRPSDFTYAYDRVRFTARVWESRIPQGWKVDLDLDVMRSSRFTCGQALHDWFVRYEQRTPTPTYIRFRVHGHPGWLSHDQLFWLIRPGIGVSVQFDGTTWPTYDVVRAAWSSHWIG